MPDDVDSEFSVYAGATLDGMLELRPELATEMGDHRHDDRLTVGTAEHYEKASRWAGERLAGLAAIDTGRSANPGRWISLRRSSTRLACSSLPLPRMRKG